MNAAHSECAGQLSILQQPDHATIPAYHSTGKNSKKKARANPGQEGGAARLSALAGNRNLRGIDILEEHREC
ncbi:MAG: hypothetical protein KKH22_00055, partial [Proteobacteria bacterium]|nr:hypothetical protein [Pseudomonadota bacterium]